MNLFEKADYDGRNKVINYINKEYPNRYRMVGTKAKDSSDIMVTGYTSSGEVLQHWECKDRNNYHTDYNSEWVIEDHKIKTLRNDKKRRGYYINTFKDGYIAIWDITAMTDEEIEKLPVKESDRWRKTTVINTGTEYKIKKLLPLSMAKIIKKMN